MVLDCKQYLDLSTEGRYGLEDILEVYEARLAELLRVSGRADEAEVLQRQLVDKLAAKVEEARQKVEAKRVQLTTFGLRWRKLPAEPEEGRLLTNELLSKRLSPPGRALLIRESRTQLIKRAEFEAFGLPFSLEELTRDSYVKVGDSFWHPRVETTVNGLMEDLDQVGVTGLIEELGCCIMKYRDSIASWLKGATGPLCKGKRSTSYGYVNLFTKAQGLHMMLMSHNKPAEAAKLVEPLVQAYFEQISGTWLGPASTKLIKCRLDENDRVHWHIREEDKGPEEPFQWKAERELLEHIIGVDLNRMTRQNLHCLLPSGRFI